MKYYKQYLGENAVTEISRDEAKRMLEGWWKPEFLQEVFDKEKAFRLWTAFSVVWTKDENGLVPMAGFMGVCE